MEWTETSCMQSIVFARLKASQDAVAVKADLEEVQDMLEAGFDYTDVVNTLRSFYAQYESMQDHSLETIDGAAVS